MKKVVVCLIASIFAVISVMVIAAAPPAFASSGSANGEVSILSQAVSANSPLSLLINESAAFADIGINAEVTSCLPESVVVVNTGPPFAATGIDAAVLDPFVLTNAAGSAENGVVTMNSTDNANLTWSLAGETQNGVVPKIVETGPYFDTGPASINNVADVDAENANSIADGGHFKVGSGGIAPGATLLVA